MPSESPRKRVGDILKAIGRIRDHVEDCGGIDALMRDEYLHRDAVERQLLIVAETAAKLRGQVEGVAPEIDWAAVGGIGISFVITTMARTMRLSVAFDLGARSLKAARDRILAYFPV